MTRASASPPPVSLFGSREQFVGPVGESTEKSGICSESARNKPQDEIRLSDGTDR